MLVNKKGPQVILSNRSRGGLVVLGEPRGHNEQYPRENIGWVDPAVTGRERVGPQGG